MLKTVDDYFDQIDSARTLRVRELSEIKRIFGDAGESDPLGIRSKALVVLCYAAWEGFYNECVEIYFNFLQTFTIKVSDVAWKLLVGILESEFESLRARNHSQSAQIEFIAKFRDKLTAGFDLFDRKAVKSRSNLNWSRLDQNFKILDLDVAPLLTHRNRLDVEVAGWRHGVAHGDAPNLDQLDAAGHVYLIGQIMALVADAFQAAMVRYV